MELTNRWVNFRIRDVCWPESNELVFELHADDVLHGKVIGISDSGKDEAVFAVIQVQGIQREIVVPVESLRLEE